MKTWIHLSLAAALALTVPACTLGTDSGENQLVGQAEQDGAVGTAEQDGAVGTAEQDGAVGTAEQDGAVGTAEQDGAVGTAEQAMTIDEFWDLYYCMGYTSLLRHYTYSDGSGTYKWDVTKNLDTGKTWVDERRIGGGFYKQYVESPTWTTCPASVETITLTNSGVSMTGAHNCLPSGVEEVHLEKQRELYRASPFRTCVP